MGLMNQVSEQIDREVELIQDAFSEFTMNENTGHDTNDFVDTQQIRQWLEKRWKAELNRQVQANEKRRQEHWNELGLERRLEERVK